MVERDAVALATSTPDGASERAHGAAASPRRDSFGWYTNYESRKGRELEENPVAALLWYCEPLGRQVRMKGPVEKMSAAESDAYFAAPRARQPTRRARQPPEQPIASREELEERVREFDASSRGATFRGPTIGAAIDSRPIASSSGSTARTGCTIGWSYLPEGSSWRRSAVALNAWARRVDAIRDQGMRPSERLLLALHPRLLNWQSQVSSANCSGGKKMKLHPLEDRIVVRPNSRRGHHGVRPGDSRHRQGEAPAG